jgi:pyruvate/2-oxoacid:ferredoxin oxidoreductase alpha subunit
MVMSHLEDFSVQSANRTLMSGDEALAWAALDSCARIATAYPGTPATDVHWHSSSWAEGGQ